MRMDDAVTMQAILAKLRAFGRAMSAAELGLRLNVLASVMEEVCDVMVSAGLIARKAGYVEGHYLYFTKC